VLQTARKWVVPGFGEQLQLFSSEPGVIGCSEGCMRCCAKLSFGRTRTHTRSRPACVWFPGWACREQVPWETLGKIAWETAWKGGVLREATWSL